MHLLTIVFGPAATAWTFCFKTRESAASGYSILPDGNRSITDDFGQSGTVMKDQIHGVMIDDTEASADAAIERNLFSMRLQAKYAQKVNADPALRAAMAVQQMAHGGSPVIMPGSRA